MTERIARVTKQAAKTDVAQTPALSVVMVPVGDVTRNPRNYRSHPRAQVAEIERSLYEFGQYKPVVLASDGVLLAGHGVLEGALAKGDAQDAAVYMPFPADDPRAAKLMVADNELSRLAEDDGTALAALLADIQQQSVTGLEGTGHDAASLDRMIGELAAQTPYSPNLQPELSDKQYTDGDLEKEQQRLDGQYQKEKDLEAITCPHCGGEFFIDK